MTALVNEKALANGLAQMRALAPLQDDALALLRELLTHGDDVRVRRLNAVQLATASGIPVDAVVNVMVAAR